MAHRDPDKALAAAVKAHKNADGTVTVYPTEPAGEVTVPGEMAIKHEVSVERAIELMAYQPPAFTLYESGNPMPEQKAIADAAFVQAWSAADEVDASIVQSQPEAAPPEGEPSKEV